MSFSLPSRAAALLAVFSLSAIGTAAEEARWYKGNLHTHSLWSDGNDYPEMIADWSKAQGYNFLALSDHDVLQEGERWLELKAPVSIKGEVNQRGGSDVLKRYIARFGNSWVQQREVNGKQQVRLKPLAEYRVLLEEPGRFLMIPSEEVTSAWKQEKTATEPERGGPVTAPGKPVFGPEDEWIVLPDGRLPAMPNAAAPCTSTSPIHATLWLPLPDEPPSRSCKPPPTRCAISAKRPASRCFSTSTTPTSSGE